MSVKLTSSDDYVKIEQSSYFDQPTNLKPDEARKFANDILKLADEVEGE